MKTPRTKFRLRLGGFTLVEIMIVIAIIGLLVAIAIPSYVRSRANSQANACINNLRELDSASQQFAIERNKHVNDSVNFPSDLTPYIKLNSANSIPPCPAGGIYSIFPVGSNPSAQCSVGSTVTPAHIQNP